MSNAAQNIIKAKSADAISPVFGMRQGEVAPIAAIAAEDSRQSELEQLQHRIAMLEAEAVAKDALIKEAYDEGYAKGRDDAEAEFEDNREKALEALKAGLADADAALNTTLERVEEHALLLAAEALDTLMGDPDAYRQILATAIRRQLAQFGDAAVLSIRVSRSDFPDSREVLKAAPDTSNFENLISVSDDLAAGRCEIRLLVGAAEIDVKRTWTEIKQILAEQGADRDNAVS